MPSLAMPWICNNGSFVPEETALFSINNRSFRYGDGIFETMKSQKGALSLATFHFDRFFSGLKTLELSVPANLSREYLIGLITELCRKNDCFHSARIRLAAFRSEDNSAAFVIEAQQYNSQGFAWAEKGWHICLHPFIQKSCDAYANLKSANFLPYVLAGRHAAAHHMDECIVLNGQNHICDGSRTNIFLIRENIVYTPALHQGCINGVMRRYLIQSMQDAGYLVRQEIVTATDLLQADEVFCTNAL